MWKPLLLLLFVTGCTAAEDITCTYYQASVRYNSTSGRTMHLCRIDGIDYELPEDFLADVEELDFESGSTQLQFHDMQPNDETKTIDVMTDTPSMAVLPQLARLEVSRTSGTRNVLVVRVISDAGGSQARLEPSFTREKLRNNIFGDPNNPYRLNFNLQYELCSNGNLKFEPASHNGDSMGVFDLVLTENLRNQDFSLEVETALSQAFSLNFGAASQFDHVMFCLPGGMNEEFIAFATLNDRFSFYSDPWCGIMSASMHEIGHNMGMRHSGELGEREYDDESCVMGIGYGYERAPQKCFNGQKFWAFDWFPSQKQLINPVVNGEWKGNLAAFVDVDLTPMKIVLNVGDLYLVYNRAKKHNYQVNEKPDMVTIVKAKSPTSDSEMLAGIDDATGTSSYTGDAVFADGVYGVTIEVCKIVEGSIDYAQLSIRRQNTPSSCLIFNTAPSRGNPGDSCNEDSDCSGSSITCENGTNGLVCKGSSGRASNAISSGMSSGRGGASNASMRRLRNPTDGRRRGRNHRD